MPHTYVNSNWYVCTAECHIPMCIAIAVYVLYGSEQLARIVEGCGRRQPSIRRNRIQEVAPRHERQNKCDLPRVLDDVQQAHNVCLRQGLVQRPLHVDRMHMPRRLEHMLESDPGKLVQRG